MGGLELGTGKKKVGGMLSTGRWEEERGLETSKDEDNFSWTLPTPPPFKRKGRKN